MTKMITLRPPIARLGGKSRLRNKIIPQIPNHTCYVEPFFGAGWVYFGKEPSKVEVINDIDQELVNLFRVIKLHPEELDKYLKNDYAIKLSNRTTFSQMQKVDKATLTDIQRAARFMYLNKFSFASKGMHYGYGTTQPPKKQIDLERITKLSERLENTYIESLPATDIIKRYDREETFFMVDPPYLETSLDFSFDQQIEFSFKEHEELRDCLASIKGKFLLTINDHEYIRELYKDFSVDVVEVPYSVSNGKVQRVSELMIRNY